MSAVTARFKHDVWGYLALVLLIGVIVSTHLLSLCIFLLFIYLATDVFTNGIHSRFPRAPVRLLFWLLYLLIVAGFTLVSIRIIPLFFADFSEYYAVVQRDATGLLQAVTEKYGISLDLDLIKEKLFAAGGSVVGQFVKMFKGLSTGFVFFIFALVLNFLLFMDRKKIEESFTAESGSLLAYLYFFVVRRVERFYFYFRKVMGGQVIISLINTLITLAIVLVLNLPHKISLLSLVFLCGLLPVVGNLVSNTILTVTALLSAGLAPAAACLGLLIGIHKLEYFLNSKIIGGIINLPMFLTLLSLLLGEALLGIPGIILAIPVVLTVKEELKNISAVRES